MLALPDLSVRRAFYAMAMVLPAIALGLSACTVGPNYVKPETEIEMPDEWERSVTEEMSSDTLQLELWWTRLGDTTLTSLIRRAELNNLDLASSVARVRESRAIRGIATGGNLPNISLDGSYTRTQLSDNSPTGRISEAVNGSNDPQDSFLGGLNASWEIDVFGRIRRDVESATASLEASVEDYRDVLVTLYAEVALSYIDVRTFQMRREFATANAEGQRGSLGLTRDRFRAGLTSALDVAQAESNLAQTEAVIPILEIGLASGLNRLAVLLGQQPGTLHEELAVSASIPTPPDSIAVGLPVDLLRRRPDVRRAERELAAQTAKIGVATAQLYPSFSLFGTLSLNSQTSNEFFSSGSFGWSLVPGVRWNIFQGGKIRQLIKVETARTDQALLAYEQSVLFALEDVENALVAYEQERLRRDRLDAAAAASQRAVDLVRTQYLSGLTNFQNVLDSERSLFRQQDELAESEGLVVQSLIVLNKALGGGWPEKDQRAEIARNAQEEDLAGETADTAGGSQ
ncbi:MAG: efflux transporter outer membrane subunit [Rhodothermia bacterium]